MENRRWTLRGVTYATLNVQGSCNNLCDTAPDPDEYAARNQANIAWLQETFAEAQAPHSAAVMLICAGRSRAGTTATRRARPRATRRRWPRPTAQPDGFQDFLTALRDEMIAFRRPVAYVHGDSHYFRIDKPLLDARARGWRTSRASRRSATTQENGNNDVHWLKVLVDPGSREVFAFQPQIVPANRVAVPAP